MKDKKQIEIMKEALKSIANSYGNPYNSQEAVIIARDAIRIASNALDTVGNNN